jgi:hypothetical protein
LAARYPERYLDYAFTLSGRIAETDNKAVVENLGPLDAP